MAATVFPPGVFRRAAVVASGCAIVGAVGVVFKEPRIETTEPILAWEWVMDKEASCMNDEKCAKARAYREELERYPHFRRTPHDGTTRPDRW